MSRKTRRQANTVARPRSNKASLPQELLLRMAQILVQAGHAPSDLALSFAQVCQELEEGGSASDDTLRETVARLPDVLTLWHTERDYIDLQGNPLPLPLRGSRRALAQLIHQVFPDGDPAEVARLLVESRSVRRIGRMYHAVTRHVSFAENVSHAQIHSLESMRSLMQTVQHNIDCEDPEQRLLERSAVNHSIPVRVLATVRRRFKWQLGAAVNHFDTYLRGFEVAPGSEPTATVRVGVYASEHPLTTSRIARSKPPVGARRRRKDSK